MNLIPKGLLSSLNYGRQNDTYTSLFTKSYDQMFKLFTSRRVRDEGTNSFYLPKMWAPTVYHTMRKMIEVDPNVKFISLSERYGKLNMEFLISDEDSKPKIMDLIYSAQTRIDNINHGLASRFLDKNPQMMLAIEDEKWLLIKGVLHTGN